MAFGEEARLLMMRVLQNFVRANRGRWDDQDWQDMVARVRRLGFDTITDERILQLATDNRERWLAGENGVGPPPPASVAVVPARIVPPPVIADVQPAEEQTADAEPESTPAPTILDAVGMSGMATTEVVECGGDSGSLEDAVAADAVVTGEVAAEPVAEPVGDAVVEPPAPEKPKRKPVKKAKKVKKKPKAKKKAKKKPAKKKAKKKPAKKKAKKKVAKKKAKKKTKKKAAKKAKKKKAKKKAK